MTTHRIVFTLLFVLALAALSTSQDRRSRDFETLEGAWIIDIDVPPAPRAQILATFARGGTIVADGNAANPVLRSSWHGLWTPRSYLDFTSTWRRWNFDAAGNVVGATEFRLDIDVDRRLEAFSGTVEARILDRAGSLTASRPGAFRATRLNIQRPSL